MCFYLNDVSYAETHSHSIMDIDRFIQRLEDPCFVPTLETDYKELTALILILDIALDDGRSTKVDLSDAAAETKFNKDVDALAATIKDIMTSIGTPGPGFVSRIDAKEVLEVVSQRITDTVRSKSKPKHTWFNDSEEKKVEDMRLEQKGMANFLSRMERIGTNGTNGTNGISGQAK